MIETKKIFEEDSYNVCGYYSDGHVNKEDFQKMISWGWFEQYESWSHSV